MSASPAGLESSLAANKKKTFDSFKRGTTILLARLSGGKLNEFSLTLL